MKCYELEGLAYQLLEFSMSQEVKKGLSEKNFWCISRKPMRFYLLTTKDSLMGKVWGKTFDAKNPGPLLQKSPLNWNIFSLK